MVHFFQGPCPKVILKSHNFFFFLRCFLLSEAKIHCVQCQLSSKTGTMKILVNRAYVILCKWIVSVLESNTYPRSQSRLQVSRADSNVQEHRTHTSRRTLAVILNGKTIYSRRTQKVASPLAFPRTFIRKTKVSSAWTIPDVPFDVPTYTTYWEAKSVLFFLRRRLSEIFNKIVNPKFSKKLPNTPSDHCWSPIRYYPQCPPSNRSDSFFSSLTPKQREGESSLKSSPLPQCDKHGTAGGGQSLVSTKDTHFWGENHCALGILPSVPNSYWSAASLKKPLWAPFLGCKIRCHCLPPTCREPRKWVAGMQKVFNKWSCLQI